MFNISSKILFVAVLINSGNLALANDSAVDVFINDNRTFTYDCPVPENYSQLEEYLALDTITEQQRLALSVEQSHFLLCEGKTQDAHNVLFSVIDTLAQSPDNDLYSLALFNIGYGYDALERQERCDYYEQAKAISSPTKYGDVYLSSSLGLITNCDKKNSVTDRLRSIFYILQTYSKTDNYGAIAHIHNNIGLIYGTELQQYAMAAEQYMAAHEIGLPVSTGSNQLSILISAITAQLASGQFDAAYQAIIEFDRINQEVGTPLTNFYYYYSLASYYYRIEDIQQMKLVLPDLIHYAKPMENSFIQQLVVWFNAVPCVYEGNVECTRRYIDENKNKPTNRNQLYFSFLVRAYILLGDKESTLDALNKLNEVTAQRYHKSQESAGILGVANLYSQIETLELEIEAEHKFQQKLIISSVFIIIITLGLLGYFLRKKQLERMSVDPVTLLLNSKTAVSRIAKIEAPESGRTNALAIFDLDNFRELNIVLGPTSNEHVLREIAKSFQSVIRATDIVGRFAPEQFVLCLHDIEEQSAVQFFNRVQKELNNTRFEQGENDPINVRSSMSIFTTTERFSDLDTIFEEMLLSMSIQAKNYRNL